MKHIKIKSSEVLHGGKTLDKEIKDINIKIGKIAPDGTKIATRESLGNVIIGDNINVNEKGTISIPIAHPQDETYGLVTSEIYLDNWENYIKVAMSDDGKLGVPKALSGGEYGVVAANENISNWNSYVNVAIDNYGKLGVPKGNPEKYGVIKPNYNDFDFPSGVLSLKHETLNVPTANGNLEYDLYCNKGKITQQYVSVASIGTWAFEPNFDSQKQFICNIVKKLLQGVVITYVGQIKESNQSTIIHCVIGNLKLTYHYNKNSYNSINEVINNINVSNWNNTIINSGISIDFDYKYNNASRTSTLWQTP